MIVTLDGSKLDGTFGGHSTLRSLIDQVRKDFANERLVVSVTVNGERFVEEGLDQRLAAPVAEQDQINLESYDRTELVADALREMSGRIGEAIPKQTAIAEKLNKGDTPAAIEDIGEFVLLWQTCQKTVVQGCDVLRTDLTANDYQGAALRDHLKDLADKLRDIRDALDASDFVLLADLLHYETPELCRTWQGILNEMAEQVSAPKQPAETAKV